MSNISLYDNIYRKLVPILFKVLIFFTPLIFVMGTNEIFEFPKTYFVYAIGITIIWLFLIQRILSGKKIKPPSIFVLVFLGVYTLSTLLSSHGYTSLWGYYTRFNGGLFSVLVLLGIYTVLDNEFGKEDIIKLISIGSISILPIGIYAILQHFGITAEVWKGDPTVRAFSTLGQPNWLAAYIAMYLPFIFGNVIGVTEKEKLLIDNKYFNATLFLIGFAALWFTYSISGILGLSGGMIIFLILNFNKILENISISLLLIFISIVIAGLTPGIFDEKIKDIFVDLGKISSSLFVVSADDGSDHDDNAVSDPGYIRNYLWKGTINLAQSSTKNLLIGTGPETFPYEFQKFRPSELNNSSEWNLVFNKPHNYYLELLANVGLLGLISYSALFLIALKSRDKIFLPGLITLVITNFFGWPTISTALLFWIFLLGVQKND